MSDPEAEYGLVMPFVTVVSANGPHDDVAYVAGFEMGALDAQLELAALARAVPTTTSIHTANRPQADLIAMKHGFTPTFTAIEGHEDWLCVDFTNRDADV